MVSVCAVAGCNSEATARFEVREPILLQWVVCEPHSLELRVSPYSTSADGQELIVGEDVPSKLLNFEITNTISPDSLVTMVFGRDGHEEQRVRFFMSPADARDICLWVAGSDHPYRGADE